MNEILTEYSLKQTDSFIEPARSCGQALKEYSCKLSVG